MAYVLDKKYTKKFLAALFIKLPNYEPSQIHKQHKSKLWKIIQCNTIEQWKQTEIQSHATARMNLTEVEQRRL